MPLPLALTPNYIASKRRCVSTQGTEADPRRPWGWTGSLSCSDCTEIEGVCNTVLVLSKLPYGSAHLHLGEMEGGKNARRSWGSFLGRRRGELVLSKGSTSRGCSMALQRPAAGQVWSSCHRDDHQSCWITVGCRAGRFRFWIWSLAPAGKMAVSLVGVRSRVRTWSIGVGASGPQSIIDTLRVI